MPNFLAFSLFSLFNETSIILEKRKTSVSSHFSIITRTLLDGIFARTTTLLHYDLTTPSNC